MDQSLNGRAVSKPIACRRILTFDYCDGPMAGVLETQSGDVYRFEFVAEVPNPDGLDRRTFVLRPMPADGFDRLVAIIAPHIPPNWPDWMPVWRFADAATRAAVEDQTDAILAEAGPHQWEVTADGLSSVSSFCEVRRVTTPTLPME